MPKCVFSTLDIMELELVKSALDDNDIENYLENYYSNSLKITSWAASFAGINTTIGDINIIVRDEDFERALEIIDTLFIKDTVTDINENSDNILEVEKDSCSLINEEKNVGDKPISKIRTPFASIMLFISLIDTFYSVSILYLDLIYIWETMYLIYAILYLISIIIGIIGIIFLFNWKKLGFWLFLGTKIIDIGSGIYLLISDFDPGLLQSLILGVAILWFLFIGLKTKNKYNKSTWEQLL